MSLLGVLTLLMEHKHNEKPSQTLQGPLTYQHKAKLKVISSPFPPAGRHLQTEQKQATLEIIK